jgi:hypothetical protein
MKIESKIEENVPIQGNNRFNSVKSVSFNSKVPDFEAYLQELDDNKAQQSSNAELADCEQRLKDGQNLSKMQLNTNNQAASELKDNKNLKQAKGDNNTKETLKKLTGKEKFPAKINDINDIKLFLRKKEGLKPLDKDIKTNLDHFKKEDINFFRACLENPSMTLNNLNPQNFQATFAVQNQDNQVSYKSFDVSKGLFNLIEYSFKAQKPVRLDFNGNSSVILKMHNDGKLIAEFISNDKAMEYILKSSIPNLKDKLDAEGIPYEEISYKDNSGNNNKRQNKGGNQ